MTRRPKPRAWSEAELVYNTLKWNGSMTASELQEATGLKSDQIRAAVRRLVTRKDVRLTPGRRFAVYDAWCEPTVVDPVAQAAMAEMRAADQEEVAREGVN